MEIRKKSRDASSNVGEFARLITTSVPSSAWSRPFPVIRSTPVDGAAGTASCPAAVSFRTTCEPVSPVPPMTASFMVLTFHGVPPGTGFPLGTLRVMAQAAIRPIIWICPQESPRGGRTRLAPPGARPAGHLPAWLVPLNSWHETAHTSACLPGCLLGVIRANAVPCPRGRPGSLGYAPGRDALPRGFVQRDRRGRGGVQRGCRAQHRNPGQLVASLAPGRAEPSRLVTHEQQRRLREIDVGHVQVAVLVGPDQANAGAAGAEGLSPVEHGPVRANPDHGYREQRAGAGPYRPGVVHVGGVAGAANTGRPEGIGRPDHRREVARARGAVEPEPAHARPPRD